MEKNKLKVVLDYFFVVRNKELLYNALCEIGYEAIYPDGAFYMFVKSLEESASNFSERAKKYELLIVPSDSFGFPGYVRLSYCVSFDMIKRSIPAFKALFIDTNRNTVICNSNSSYTFLFKR